MLNGSDRRAHLRRLERLREGFLKKVAASNVGKPLTLPSAPERQAGMEKMPAQVN
jgi:hypothetical protein